MAVLRERGPRILGGRDELAGGTWLAVNDAGLVAGLTNRPMPGGRDPSKRSRGELPLLLASFTTAADAVRAFEDRVDADAYNPAWLLVGDRSSLYAIDLTGDAVRVTPLGPGVHVLENQALGEPSAKTRHVRAILGDPAGAAPDELVSRLQIVLADHTVPGRDDGSSRPSFTTSPCVHSEQYGTRWSAVVLVAQAADHAPDVRYADGAPCETSFLDASDRWQTGDGAGAPPGTLPPATATGTFPSASPGQRRDA